MSAPTPIPNLLPGKPRPRAELAFLPAALELVETPPAPLGRIVSLAVCLFLGLAVLWACLSEIDVTAMAQGQVVPAGRSKTVQPLEAGIVRALHVADGDRVEAGQVLVELDPTDATRLTAELRQAGLEAARLRAQYKGEARIAVDLDGLTPAQLRLQERLLQGRLDEHGAKLAALDGEARQRTAERAAIAAEHARLEAVLPLVRERASARRRLAAKGVTPRLEALEAEEARIDTEHALKAAARRLEETDAALDALADRRREAEAAFKGATLTELAAAEARVAGLRQETAKARARQARMTLTAPVAGTVQELAVTTLGGVVTPAQALMTVVPEEQDLRVEVWIENKDVGFVHEGQAAEVKVEAFPFTKYGLIHGTIVALSRDAVERDTPAGPAAGFAATVALARDTLDVEGRTVRLTPGMAVQADIKTGKRRVIDYLLGPVMKAKHESLQER